MWFDTIPVWWWDEVGRGGMTWDGGGRERMQQAPLRPVQCRSDGKGPLAL